MRRKIGISSTVLTLSFAVGLAATAGCSDLAGSDNELSSSLTDYDLVFDAVAILDQTDAVIIRYIRRTANEQWPTVIVANKPIEVGKKINLAAAGSVYRKTSNNVEWPDVTEGYVAFDEWGGADQPASGVFYATFVGGGTLNGKFSGTAVASGF